jgi:hypothetical protein
MFHFKKQKDNTKEVAGSVAFRPKAHQALLWSSLTQRVSLVGARSRAVVSKETLEVSNDPCVTPLPTSDGPAIEHAHDEALRMRGSIRCLGNSR